LISLPCKEEGGAYSPSTKRRKDHFKERAKSVGGEIYTPVRYRTYFIQYATNFLAIGAKMLTNGNAHNHATRKACSQRDRKPESMPVLSAVKIPDIQNAIKNDMVAANRSCCFFSLVIAMGMEIKDVYGH
jgi:hypothetical protein